MPKDRPVYVVIEQPRQGLRRRFAGWLWRRRVGIVLIIVFGGAILATLMQGRP
jgi:hypothetical protein